MTPFLSYFAPLTVDPDECTAAGGVLADVATGFCTTGETPRSDSIRLLSVALNDRVRGPKPATTLQWDPKENQPPQ